MLFEEKNDGFIHLIFSEEEKIRLNKIIIDTHDDRIGNIPSLVHFVMSYVIQSGKVEV